MSTVGKLGLLNEQQQVEVYPVDCFGSVKKLTCGPYIYRSVGIVAGTDHHWNHLFFGYCPLFWDKDLWDKWFGENKKMCWCFLISPEYLTIAEDQHTNQLR